MGRRSCSRNCRKDHFHTTADSPDVEFILVRGPRPYLHFSHGGVFVGTVSGNARMRKLAERILAELTAAGDGGEERHGEG